ncbi:hypothetical protein [[Mycoplasma] anseris]|uniref:Uncharacterized protein n=1 Tax=[Mycoplasma] anseris TaxID=92400 RepID=A0A2Z4NCT0_9BACT|nr:hypothetical protein [[Mycoplasma] anseris]AWX69360.1 hypothetical protein DP065_01140 [[Mycoplasma] anseris]
MKLDFLLNPTTTNRILHLISKDKKEVKSVFGIMVAYQILMYLIIFINFLSFGIYFVFIFPDKQYMNNVLAIRLLVIMLSLLVPYLVYLLISFTWTKKWILNYYENASKNKKTFQILQNLMFEKNCFFFKTNLLFRAILYMIIYLNTFSFIILWNYQFEIWFEMIFNSIIISIMMLTTIINNAYNLNRINKLLIYKTKIELQIKNNSINLISGWVAIFVHLISSKVFQCYFEKNPKRGDLIGGRFLISIFAITLLILFLFYLTTTIISLIKFKKENINKKQKICMIFLPILF